MDKAIDGVVSVYFGGKAYPVKDEVIHTSEEDAVLGAGKFVYFEVAGGEGRFTIPFSAIQYIVYRTY